MKQTLGLIVGNRGFFPDELAREGREKIIATLEKMGFAVIALTPEDTKFGTVETWEDAQKCARLFDQYRKEISGIVVTLPNFGDEKGVAYAIRFSELKVPVLIHAFPDKTSALDVKNRRDSFCGKMSVCNNLKQFDIPFSLTTFHTEDPDDPVFAQDLEWFSGVCRVVQGFKNIKVGAIGARPNAFNTVRFSEKLLESYGISVEVADFSEILGQTNRLSDTDPLVNEKTAEIKNYIDTSSVPEAAIRKMAKLKVVLEQWVKETGVSLLALQCWTSIEQNFGIMPCTVMSMFSENLIPAACEVDVTGSLSMYALQLASSQPSALVDWNNNVDDDPDKAILFHCSNFPKSLLEGARMGYGDIISSTLPKEQTYGTCYGTIPQGPLTLCRLSTDEVTNGISAYLAEGEITPDVVQTFGGVGVARIPALQELLGFICERGFEHHVAINRSSVADLLAEAFDKYLGFDTYWHSEE